MEHIRRFQFPRGWAVLACGFIVLVLTAKSGAQITARPVIRDLNPNSATVGTPDLTLTIDGSGFVPPAPPGSLSPLPGDGSQVQWNGTLLKTTFTNTTKLIAVVPAGLIANPTTVTVTVLNPGQLVSNASTFTVTAGVSKAPSLAITTSTPLPNGATGAIYAQLLTADGGSPPYTWSIKGGQLPPGVILSSTSGVLSGTPTAQGAYSFHTVVTDRAQATAGSEFTLAINSPGSISAVVNGASFLSGPVAPGTIISIFGSEIGPATGVGLQLNFSRQVGTLLGGSRVLFDGVPAPLISVQARQVNAVVPYEVAGKTRSVMQMEFQGKTSAGVTVPLTDSSPGLFTLDSSGEGQGVILNQDATVNSASNPALKGSVVVLYATGGGQTDPLGVSGILTSEPWPKPHLPVSVTVGGLPAETLYTGAAPGLLAGLLQLNVRIPEGAPSGSAVPVALTIGSATSQPGVTVALR